jgi:hypothetical protein
MSSLQIQKSGPAASPRVKATKEELEGLEAIGVKLSRKERRAKAKMERARKP